jgi:methanogenic corrinoid protein MtbC1
MVFGIALNRCGWRVTFLGNNTPVTDLDNAVRHLEPQVVVLSATTSEPFVAAVDGLRSLAERVPVVLAGAGATEEVLAATGTSGLLGDPVTEALHLQVPTRSAPAGAGP